MKKITKMVMAFLVIVLLISGFIYFAYVDESTSKLIKAEKDDANIAVDNTEEKPEWEFVFAIVALLAVVYIILRKRE